MDRKKFGRVGIRCIVRYRIYDGRPRTRSDLSTIRNIGEGGILFTSAGLFPISSVLELDLTIPLATEPVKGLGELVWTEEVRQNILYRNGVKFIKFNEEDRKKIAMFVDFILKRDREFYEARKKLYAGQEKRKSSRVYDPRFYEQILGLTK